MRDRWNALSLRDKRMASLGALFVFMAIIYFVIWQPLTDGNNVLRTQIQHNKQLLAWMKTADEQIQSLQKNSKEFSISPSHASLLSIVQNEISQSSLTGKFTQLKQSENDSVQLNFQTVSFDELTAWLIKIWQKQGLVVSQISITPIDKAGTVSAEVALKRIS